MPAIERDQLAQEGSVQKEIIDSLSFEVTKAAAKKMLEVAEEYKVRGEQLPFDTTEGIGLVVSALIMAALNYTDDCPHDMAIVTGSSRAVLSLFPKAPFTEEFRLEHSEEVVQEAITSITRAMSESLNELCGPDYYHYLQRPIKFDA